MRKYTQEFLEQEIILNLFHGTSRASSDRIISEKYIKPSVKSYEWLGTGAYFWENSKSAAFFWLDKIFREDYQKAVIEVFIRVRYENIFDLNNDYWRMLFDKYKSKNPGFNDGVLFDLICDELYESGIEIKVLKAVQPFKNDNLKIYGTQFYEQKVHVCVKYYEDKGYLVDFDFSKRYFPGKEGEEII